jgi:transposase-like protein
LYLVVEGTNASNAVEPHPSKNMHEAPYEYHGTRSTQADHTTERRQTDAYRSADDHRCSRTKNDRNGYYAKSASKLARWLEAAIPEGLTVFAFPEGHQQRLRTTNGLERLNQEIRRRTRVVGVFPNEASCLRLVTALALGIGQQTFFRC